MGRQIQVAMTKEDETSLLDFLRSTAEISIFESFARSPDELWVTEFRSELEGHFVYRIWNRAFPWEPTYRKVRTGEYCVANDSNAPVVEVSRTFWDRRDYGRIYWSEDFSAPDGLDYDVDAFGKWVDCIWRWVRKNGKKILGGKSFDPYFLPSAVHERERRLRG